MKSLFLIPALAALGLMVFGPQPASAVSCKGETVYSTPPAIPNPAWADDIPKFGSFVYARTHLSSSNCDWHTTENSETGIVSNLATGQTSDGHNATTTSTDVLGRPIELDSSTSVMQNDFGGTVNISRYNYGTGVFADLVLGDILWFDKEGAGESEATPIPVKLCMIYNSFWAGQTPPTDTATKTQIQLSDFNYNGYASQDSYTLDTNIAPVDSAPAGGEVCNTGTLDMVGPGLGLKVRLLVDPASQTGTVDVDGAGLQFTQGSVNGKFELLDLPEGVVCYSASGLFPKCERKPKKEQLCEAQGGNPINFARGIKYQNETDYSGGLFSFSRLYRSDGDNAPGSLGVNWRHNFDFKANFKTTPMVTPMAQTVDVTDSNGRMTVFRKNTSGQWKPADLDVTASFEELYDGPTITGYLYTASDDTREYYDLSGNLERKEYRAGQSLDFAYSGDLLTSVTDEHGQSLGFTYDGADRLTGLSSPGGSYIYTYDANGNLATVTRPDSETRTYHYEDTNFVNALTGITDERGVRYATFAYDPVTGKAVSSQHIGGVDSFTVAYNADDSVTTTNALGKQTTYRFETLQGARKVVSVEGHASASCEAASKEKTYDPMGWLASKTDWLGNKTTYERDARGLITSKTEDAGGADERTTSYTYDALYRLPDVITETGKTTDYDYDAFGRVSSVTITDTATSEARTTSYSYHPNTVSGGGYTVLGRLASVDGPRTDIVDVTSYAYDGQGRLYKTTNASGHITEITSYDAANRPLTTLDENGIQTSFVYDALGRVESITQAVGTALAATTSYSYDEIGNVLSATLPGGIVTTNTYDNAGRLETVTDTLGNSITYAYDNAGNITLTEYKDDTATLRYTLSAVYDELSRLLQSVDANNDADVFAYDVNSNQTSVTDGNLNATSFAFDGLSRLIEQTDALNGLTAYALNALDQNEGTTDPRGNTTSYSYNAFGDVTQEISPDRGTLDYSHDKAGNVTQMTDGRGEVVNYTYDEINRLETVSYVSDSALNVTLTYDAPSGCGYSAGRLCTVSDASGTRDYIYDALGRLSSVSESRGALSFVTSYAYHPSGALSSITLPSGRVVSYSLDANGQVQSVSADVNSISTGLASSISYLPFGGVEALSYGNGLALSNGYNAAYQLTARTIGALMSKSYVYDNAGNITEISGDTYGYDALYRLTDENSLAGLFDYSYDEIGNRLSTGGGSLVYSYPATSSRLSAIGATPVLTDIAGNLSDDGAREMVWNAAGQLEEVKISGSAVGAYVYDSQNLRTAKSAGGITTHYVYGAGGLLYGEYDASGALIREYVYLNGEPLAQVDAGETLTYLHTDHLSTPRVGTDVSGSNVWSWVSDAFGNAAPTGTALINLRMAGQYYDSESGLFYNWNRYYDPETGRYVSSDPIGLEGGINTFAYVSANPVMFTDPEGLCVAGCIGDVAAAGLAAEFLAGACVGAWTALGGYLACQSDNINCSGDGEVATGEEGLNDEEQRQKEHDDYKARAEEKIIPDPQNPCDHHLKTAQQAERFAQDMRDFDLKYKLNGKHDEAIRNADRRARKARKRYKNCLEKYNR